MGVLFLASARATDGTKLIGIGALQKGTGGAGVASPKDMTWVLLNPASIIDLGCRLDVNLELFAPYRTLQPHGIMGNPLAGDMDDDSYFFIPSVGYSRACECGDEAWGIGLYGVSGMGVEYPHARTILPPLFGQNYDRKTEYSVAKFAVAYAHTLGNTDWTVGIAPHINLALFRTNMLTLRFAESEKSNGWDISAGAGLSVGIYRHWQRFGVGAAYTSRQWMTDFKSYDDLFFESMDMPQEFQAGVAFDVTPSVELVLDYKYINWSGIDQMAEEPFKGGFGWKDQHIVKAGATWFASPEWTFRGGVSVAESPIKEEYVFANGLFPAVTEKHASVGFTYAPNDKHEFHFTYMHAFNNTMRDNGFGDIFSIAGAGTKFSLRENTFTFGYSYKFNAGGCAERRLKWKEEDYLKRKGKGRF